MNNVEQIFVGIHARMTDHKSLERETGRIPVKASYFVQAMDLYRHARSRLSSHFPLSCGKVLFLRVLIYN